MTLELNHNLEGDAATLLRSQVWISCNLRCLTRQEPRPLTNRLRKQG